MLSKDLACTKCKEEHTEDVVEQKKQIINEKQ